MKTLDLVSVGSKAARMVQHDEWREDCSGGAMQVGDRIVQLFQRCFHLLICVWIQRATVVSAL